MIHSNYSGTKCPKCEKTNFELVEDIPNKSNYKYYYLRCSNCRTFLHALPIHHTNAVIEESEKNIITKINSIDTRTNSNISALNQNIVNGFNQLISLLKDKK